MLRILLVEDQSLFRKGLKLILNDLSNGVECIEANSCEDVLNLECCEPFQIILLDYHLPGANGVEALQIIKLRHETSRIVVLSSEEDPKIVRRVIEYGAVGFIPKSATPEILIAALKLVLAGGVYLPQQALVDIAGEGDCGTGDNSEPSRLEIDPFLSRLTPRERETLIKIIEGKSNKVIARDLDLAEGTIKAHLSGVYRVLGVNKRTEAVYKAAKLGLTIEILEIDVETSQ